MPNALSNLSTMLQQCIIVASSVFLRKIEAHGNCRTLTIHILHLELSFSVKKSMHVTQPGNGTFSTSFRLNIFEVLFSQASRYQAFIMNQNETNAFTRRSDGYFNRSDCLVAGALHGVSDKI